MQQNLSKLSEFASAYRDLFRDKRLFTGFVGTLQGILGSQSLCISKIANSSSLLSGQHAERRVRRLVHGDNARATLDAEVITGRLTEEGAKKLAWETEVLLILDESDLRKPFARSMEHLDTVRSLDGELIPGFHTLNVLAIGASGQRAIVYHHSFSTTEPGFSSVNEETNRAINGVTQALRQVGAGRLLWVIDRAGDNLALMKHLHNTGSSFVIRVHHVNRKCKQGAKHASLAKVLAQAPVQAEASLEKRLLDPTTKRHKYRHVSVGLAGVQVELAEAAGLEVTLCQVRTLRTEQGWMLISNLKPRAEEEAALLIKLLSVYRQRWSIEDLFAWSKAALGWERVQLMSFTALKTLVAFAWLGAAFLYELGATIDDQGVRFLAHLGGCNPDKNKPGPRTLATGLTHLSSFLVVAQYAPLVGGEDALMSLIHRLFPRQ